MLNVEYNYAAYCWEVLFDGQRFVVKDGNGATLSDASLPESIAEAYAVSTLEELDAFPTDVKYGLTVVDEYQEAVANQSHMMPEPLKGKLGLCASLGEEAGELIQKIRKSVRDNDGKLDDVKPTMKEVSDNLWILAAICNEYGFKLSDCVYLTVDKLDQRNLNGTLGGSGDDR